MCCDKCDKWHHLICVGLTGNELELEEGSDLEYFCPKCSKNIPDALAHVAEEHEPSTSHISSTNVLKKYTHSEGQM